MTVSELQRQASNGQSFVALTVKGGRLLCRWVNVRKGLFNVEQMDGHPVKGKCLCDLRGAPHAPVVEVESVSA